MRAKTLLLSLGLPVVLLACRNATGPEGNGDDSSLPDLSGSWTVSLSDGRFYDHDTGTSLRPLCTLEDLGLTLVQGDAALVGSFFEQRLEATISGTRAGATLECSQASPLPLPAPWFQDSTLTVLPGSIDGSLQENCLEPRMYACDEALTPVAQLRLPDVAPVSTEDVHFHLWLEAIQPTPTSMEGHFSLRAWEEVPGGSSSSLVMDGTWSARR